MLIWIVRIRLILVTEPPSQPYYVNLCSSNVSLPHNGFCALQTPDFHSVLFLEQQSCGSCKKSWMHARWSLILKSLQILTSTQLICIIWKLSCKRENAVI
ncbi:hypothetical protein LOK49_LG12G02737 [Camellia lanceoleosa]|uniref:Uncharacterized protein n=1 Tax=Camellia lanceoleosa TaxID=1840588 RepID=A0ACC0FUI5_9ERIC|nr:hypothetical protein LOK49_LG12G02737 [Camellia lanceoleosa]